MTGSESGKKCLGSDHGCHVTNQLMLMPELELHQGDWQRITRPKATRPISAPRNLTLTCSPGCSGGLIHAEVVSGSL